MILPTRQPRMRPSFLALLIALTAGPTALLAQVPGAEIREDALRVFLDCNANNCDGDYFRTEVTFVNWVRDRTLAQVHLIITSTQTGGGGNVYDLEFIGLEDLDAADDRLSLTTLGTDTEDEILTDLSRVIAAGLARYSVLAGQTAGFDITATDVPDVDIAQLVAESQVSDPWNFWVFEIGGQLNLSGEETEKRRSYRGGLEARRTTETWKVELESDVNLSHDERELEDGDVVIDDRTNWAVDGLLAYALADHWSLGVLSGAGASTRRNQNFGADASAALEYSFFPYEEAPRRSLTLRYDLRVQYYDWTEITIFLETEEVRLQHELELRLFQRQPWGQAILAISGRQFLADPDLWSASIFGNLEFRIFRGLELEVRGGLDLIEDQIYISAAGLTQEDILLGRFQRPTDFSYFLQVGLGFEFGSIYNNVVNNRFDSRGGGGGNFN